MRARACALKLAGNDSKVMLKDACACVCIRIFLEITSGGFYHLSAHACACVRRMRILGTPFNRFCFQFLQIPHQDETASNASNATSATNLSTNSHSHVEFASAPPSPMPPPRGLNSRENGNIDKWEEQETNSRNLSNNWTGLFWSPAQVFCCGEFDSAERPLAAGAEDVHSLASDKEGEEGAFPDVHSRPGLRPLLESVLGPFLSITLVLWRYGMFEHQKKKRSMQMNWKLACIQRGREVLRLKSGFLKICAI